MVELCEEYRVHSKNPQGWHSFVLNWRQALEPQAGTARRSDPAQTGASQNVTDQVNTVLSTGQRDVEQPALLCMRIRLSLCLQGLNEWVSDDLRRQAGFAFAESQQDDVIGLLAFESFLKDSLG
jgi:hypothetical protein